MISLDTCVLFLIFKLKYFFEIETSIKTKTIFNTVDCPKWVRGPSYENHWFIRMRVKNHNRKELIFTAVASVSHRGVCADVGKFVVEFGGDGISAVNHRRSADLGVSIHRSGGRTVPCSAREARGASEEENERGSSYTRAGRSKVFTVIRCCTRLRSTLWPGWGQRTYFLATIATVFTARCVVRSYARLACV